jgi:hypothetical protein
MLHHLGSSMTKCIRIALLVVMAAIPGASLYAQDISQQQMRSLDEQVQEIKSDVLNIAAELNQLEEKLLYPSNTQLAVFVSMAEDEPFRLDAVQIEIDGELVAHYIYSFKELEALQKGGVQRVYTGNVPTGSHRIGISVIGKLPSGKDYSNSGAYDFVKGVEPKLLGITLAGTESGNSGIQLGDW